MEVSTVTMTVITPAFRAAEAWHPRVLKHQSLRSLKQNERYFERTVLSHLSAYLKLVLQHYESIGSLSDQEEEVDHASTLLLDGADREFDLKAAIRDIRLAYSKALELGASYGASDLPKGARIAAETDVLLEVDWNITDPEVEDWIQNHSSDLITNILETTRDRIRSQITTGVRNGESRDEIAKRISNVLDDIPQWRAKLIAQTEVIAAHSEGAEQVYKKSGVVQSKRWVDGQLGACSTCSGKNGEIVALEKSFSNGSRNPPAHPGCRCTIAPVVTMAEDNG